ncbi:heterogeneous nuclear ribonucleoprotein Q [Phalaenopsis equestris]|uniref:heterogeneous nuclear ribonucleoprotein Q n=1 Tax=Phalaenopsis equestris TaxID=78828 RepID=UPI0009E59DCA|nr:heterogeneous nuclear ribonucleoprotein Q [Phalaenopsis equestris]XP_020590291.1 heterogeneous nuclear ribonucleoprotein Q [Phalaenopsis equestris]
MPKTRARAAAAAAKVTEPVMPAEPEEQVELDGSEEMEEEVEYEEIEEEVELEEEEEVLEEEEVEEEGIEEESDNDAANGALAKANSTLANNESVKEDGEDLEDESKKHAELLALPPHGSEVYVGGIPPTATEEELRSFCESAGEVTEVRMMKGKDSSENKGYAFVTFRTRELASKAIEKLNNTEFKGKKIKCSASQAKHRLFIGNIPRNWTEDDLRKAVLEIGPGVTSVDLMKDPQTSSRNRGFAFIEFYNHACAEYSRKKMAVPKFKLDSNAPTVSWADPKSGDSSSQIKSVYVKNLPKDVSQDQLKKLFEHHGEISKVVLPPAKAGQEKRFGFIHFAERTSAMKALKNTERYEINGEVIECSLAKPPADKKVESTSNSRKGALLPSYTAGRVGYGVMGGAYGPLTPGFTPAMIYGNRQAATGTAMVPIMLPDGRIAYVVQQPGVPITPQSHGGHRSTSSRKGNDNRGRRYNPY